MFLVFLVLVLGLGVSLGGAMTLQSFSRAIAFNEFAGPAQRFTAKLGTVLNRQTEIVASLAAQVRDHENLNRWHFHDLAAEGLGMKEGIVGIQWIPSVAAGERQRFEMRAAEDGLFDFRFAERYAYGGKAVAQQRPVHFPIYFVEPFEGQQDELGLDLLSEPATATLLSQARDSGEAVTERVAGAEAPSAFHIIQPVYRGESVPFTRAERREKLLGFLRVRFEVPTLVAAALPGVVALPGFDIYLFEPTAVRGQRLVFHGRSAPDGGSSSPLDMEAADSGLVVSDAHSFFDRNWSIILRPLPRHFLQSIDSGSWAFFAVTLLLTAVSVHYMLLTQSRTRAIERSVRARTAALRQEIAERKDVEQQLRNAKEQAEVANRAKSEFLAMMSHELRTPLNAVIGFAEVMVHQVFGPITNERYHSYADDIRTSGLHLLSLINDVLDLSKIEAKQFDLHEETFEVAEVWQMVRSLLKDKIATSGVQFVDGVSGNAILIQADKRVFRQILINLLSNAIKFTPDGGTIGVGCEITAKGQFVFSVADTGIGISEDDLKTVLQPFRQADASVARKYEGTGLGLPLTQQLVEMHGGCIKLKSSLGHGTVVRVYLPPERVACPRNWDNAAPAEAIAS